MRFITHEVNIQGPDQLEPASKKMTLNKSVDLRKNNINLNNFYHSKSFRINK